MRKPIRSEKSKIAERVIEVLDFFAAANRPATVTDIVHRYDRPQSSTSELLQSLVRMGILYRDPESRTYAPTPRLAALGRPLQPEPVSSGRLFAYMDRVARTVRCGVGLFGMVGMHVQLLQWSNGAGGALARIATGSRTRLSSSAVGLLLLSALGERSPKVLWRLHAEATKDSERFNLGEAKRSMTQFGRGGRAVGPSGFSPQASVAAVLLPGACGDRSLALGMLYPKGDGRSPLAMLSMLEHGIQNDFSPTCLPETSRSEVVPFMGPNMAVPTGT